MEIKHIHILRFIAAFWVILFHFVSLEKLQTINILIQHGAVAVSFFYVLSGFFLTYVYYNTTIDITKYYKNRFFRLYPVFLFSTLIFILIASWFNVPMDFMGLFPNMLLIQAWIPTLALSLNAPMWSLSVEVFFYTIFPALLAWVKKYGIKILLILTLLVYITNQLVYIYGLQFILNDGGILPAEQNRASFLFYFPLFHLHSFLFGIVAGYIYLKIQKTDKIIGHTIVVCMMVASSVYLFSQPHLKVFDLDIMAYIYNGLFSPLFALVILSVALNKGIISRIFSSPIATFLGKISFSLFALQYPVFLFISHLLYKEVVPKMTSGKDIVFVYLPVLFASAIFLYYCIEEPIRRKLTKKF